MGFLYEKSWQLFYDKLFYNHTVVNFSCFLQVEHWLFNTLLFNVLGHIGQPSQ